MKSGAFGILLIFLAARCVSENPVNENYFFDLDHVQGRNEPSAPVLNAMNYPADTTLVWQQSIDPDTNAPVQQYFIYFYKNGIPAGKDLYSDDYRMPFHSFVYGASTSESLSNLIFPQGTHAIRVSGFDGGRESYHSNTIYFTVP